MKIGKGFIISIIVAALLIFGISYVWQVRSTAVRLENKIEAQYVANQSEYDNMWKKFKELTQVTDLQATHYKELYTGLISGRYQDANLLFKQVKEDNPKLDATVYTQLQREITAGRNAFNNAQKKITDVVREYNDLVENQPILILMGKEPKDWNKYVVTSEKTQEAFSTKKDDQIDLRSK